MKIQNTRSLFLMLLVLFSQGLAPPVVSAQELIELTAEDISRLGIVFRPVSEGNNRAGMRVPAMVINSPDSVSTLSSLYSGVVEQWQVRPGDQVAKGDILASVVSEQVLEVEGQWSIALTAFEQAEYEFEKDEGLFQQGIISQQRLLHAQREMEKAGFELRMLEEKLSRIGLSSSQIQSLRVEHAQLGIYYLRAPGAGVVTRRIVDVGAFVALNSPLVSLQINQRLWVEANVPARLASSLQIGQSLSVAETGDELILQIKDAEIDKSNQTVIVHAELLRSADYLPGQLIAILIPPAGSGVLVPGNAVVHSGDETTVFVKTNGGVEIRTIQLIPAGTDYLAESGLSVGEELVLQGTAVLKGMQLGLGGE